MEVVEGIATVEDVDRFLDRATAIGEDHGVVVQALDARYVVDREHLRRAVALAERAFERGENVARERAVEILLYAAGTRQIERALDLGVDAGEVPVVAVLVEPGAQGKPAAREGATEAESAAAAELATLVEPAETLGSCDEQRVREWFDVSAAELAAVEGGLADVVHERVALLDVEK